MTASKKETISCIHIVVPKLFQCMHIYAISIFNVEFYVISICRDVEGVSILSTQ